jgi:hypothetical protein
MILPHLPGKTYGQVQKLAEQAAITVAPESAADRRQDAERNRCRVELSREDSGAAALSGRDLPTGHALAAHAHVCARAQEYMDSGAFPDGTRTDQYRVAAYLDLLNGIPADTRIATGQIVTVAGETDTPGNGAGGAGPEDPDEPGPADFPQRTGPGDHNPGDDNPDDDNPGDSGPDDGKPGDPGDGGGGPVSDSPGGGGSSQGLPPRLTDLVLPLATLLGLDKRPGESHTFGPLDPDLCRELAAAAIGSPWSRLCVTVTDAGGVAIGHGCAKPPRRTRKTPQGTLDQPERAALPCQVNLTITAIRLAELAAAGPPGTSDLPRPPGSVPWSLTRADASGPPGGFGTWTLTLPDGRNLTVALEPMPTFECDHRHESHAYRPNDTLRHLVQVRDYTCTFPPCNRHARESDFEHAIPFDKGGRTCACNAGARSRACHQVKQSRAWEVTQPQPGWHQWQTPAGRVYVQAPKHYPV